MKYTIKYIELCNNNLEGVFCMPEDIKRLNVPIPTSLHTKLKVLSAAQEKTLAQWVIEAIQDKLKKESELQK